MKFIYFTDPHGRANNPVSRLDNFPETILSKIKWVVETANEKGAKILCGGDWLNRPDTSPVFIGSLARILNEAKHLPIYTVLGNHDVYGYNPDTFQRTPLHILEELGIIKVLNDEPVDFGGIYLTGTSARYELDGKDKEGYLMKKVPRPQGKWIHIVHGFLTDGNFGDYIAHTDIDEIKDAAPDIILSGHEHSGFGIINRHGKMFCNPGALARVSASVGDVNMKVSALLIDTDKELSECMDLIPCPLARPAEEVIDRAKLLKEKEHAKNMQVFFETVQNVDLSMLDSSDIFSIFEEFCKKEAIADDVKKTIRKYLEKADEKLKEGD